MMRRLGTLVATAALAVGAAAAPAHADGEIGLSEDGVTWVTDLVAPIFENGFLFVPGDVEVRDFRVRNDGPSDGVLTVDVIATDPAAFLASDDLTIEARVGNGPWVDVAPGTTRAITELKVAEDARTRVWIRATFAPESTAGEDQIVPFRVRLRMSEDGDVAGVDDGDGDGDVGGADDGLLPDTGSTIGVGLLWLAAGLLGSGLALVLPRRRREVRAHG